METIYHRLISRDLRTALDYYEDEGGAKLGDRFFEDVEATAERVIANPKHFHFATDRLRRAQLRFFPYHFLFEGSDARVRFLVLRHDHRHPSYGLRRR